MFVRERTARPVGLRPHIEAAFERETVKIDFSGYTAETLHTAIQEPLDKIRDGRLTPRSISVRLLLSDMSAPIAIPSRAGDDPGDDPRVRERMAKTAQRYVGGIAESVAEIGDLQLVQSTTVEIRVHSSAPSFKLYLINDTELFWGFYPVVEHDVTIDGERVSIFDPMGKDTELFHQTASSDPEAPEACTSARPAAGSPAAGPPSLARTNHDHPAWCVLSAAESEFLESGVGHQEEQMARQGYSAEFRRRVLDRLAAGHSVASVAHDLDLSDQTIYTWRRQDRIDRGLQPGRTTKATADPAAAKKRIAELETELAVSRRALELVKEQTSPKGATRPSR